MPSVWLKRLSIILACAAPAFAEAALEAPKEVPARASLAGQLLVATPSMGDPRFGGLKPDVARAASGGGSLLAMTTRPRLAFLPSTQ